MTSNLSRSTSQAWAHFRFSVVGPLLSAPPPRGELKAALQALAAKTWTHPITGAPVQIATATIERWYYAARRARHDPVTALRRTARKDRGHQRIPLALAEQIRRQHGQYPHWSYQLHYDNLASAVKEDSKLGPLPSYSTIRRYMQAQGLLRQTRLQPKQRPGELRAAARREQREIRSYEAEYVGSLWHLDFHHGSCKVLLPSGQWQRPIVLGILDDHSRLCCHLQWYLSEKAEDLVHGLSQAIQKRGLPRALLTDNGSAMVAEEVRAGLLRLGIQHETTLPYSPYQNGKQEAFWGSLEGRLLEMLEGVSELTLDFLNRATQAWVEVEYQRREHREIGCAPVDRFVRSPDVLRESPSSDALRDAFRWDTKRRQRRSDGTISLDGVRFELPARFRHFQDVVVRYARWDLGHVDLIDPASERILAPLYPLDRVANADGRRSPIAATHPTAEPNDEIQPARDKLPPLLRQILAEYSATGMPPSYLPQRPDEQKGETA